MIKLISILLHILLLSSISLTPVTIAHNYHNGHDVNVIPDIEKMHNIAPDLNLKVLNYAVTAYNHAHNDGSVKKPLLTIIDYSLPSTKKRMWIFDIDHELLLYRTFVAHGKNSGNLYAKKFSNRPQSKSSSLGTYVTKDTYYGHKGISLNLKGLESGFNNNAYNRRVVIHGAAYVQPNFIKSHGRAGRSWGCPAVSPKLAKPIINNIKNGSIVFAYYPNKNYISHSHYTHVA